MEGGNAGGRMVDRKPPIRAVLTKVKTGVQTLPKNIQKQLLKLSKCLIVLHNSLEKIHYDVDLFNRPCVAAAVLQTASSLIN